MTTPTVDAVTLEIFRHLFASVADEMGVVLGRTGFSPNIKERRDYSCAVFLGDGRMLAQAAHIPVHLGAMPASVRAAIQHGAPFQPGDVIILNDPYLGGTHLPDITLVSPFFADTDDPDPAYFVASRAHHADIGGMSPGSMPLSTELVQEGIIIPPVRLARAGVINEDVRALIVRNSRTPEERLGDLNAQLAAHEIGARRLSEIIARYDAKVVYAHALELLAYAERLTRALIRDLPDGVYAYEDVLDGDGQTEDPVPIKLAIRIDGDELTADFSGTAPAVHGSLNAVRAIVESALLYVIRCVAGESLPTNQGVMAPLTLIIPPGSVLDPGPPHAVAGGNVETSMRVVDVIFGALAQPMPNRIPAASQGSMNNVTFGGFDPTRDRSFAYYETMGGGAGAGLGQPGASAIHCHMSNTLNTPVEALEMDLPVRVTQYRVRRGSGGPGAAPGGDGLIREFEFLVDVEATLLTERRIHAPYGLSGGAAGQPGRNVLLRDGTETPLPGKARLSLRAGDRLRIETPGGGGWGVL